MRRQRPTGCIRLAHALRAVLAARGLNPTEVSRRLKVRGPYGDFVTYSRPQVSLWCHAHRQVPAPALKAIEKLLDADFAGVNRRHSSPHHMGNFCRADLAEGPLVVTCRSTGDVLYTSADK